MAFIYAKAYISNISSEKLLIPALVFFVAVIGIASMGHFLNDYADIEQDTISGKENFVSKLSKKQKLTSLIILILICILPWFYLKINIYIIGLLIFQIILYLFYSFKPLRLKNRHIFGIIADTLYGHIIPALVVLAAFSYYGEHQHIYRINNIFTLILVTWLFCKGSRNIILHQLDDRKKDKMSGINTFVVRFGNVFSLNIVNRIILPLEFFVFLLLVYFSCDIFLNFYILFAAFLLFTLLKFSLWKIFVLPPRQMRFKFLFFLNDFYEDWLPVIMLVYLIRFDEYFLFYLVVHLLLFPKTVINLFKDIMLIMNNLKISV